jgi:hypothetical protein
MAEWPTEHREGETQPQSGTGPVGLQFDFSDPKWNYRKQPPAQVININPKNEIYEEHGRPREDIAKPRFGRIGEFDYMLGSMNTLKFENEKAELPIIANGSPYDSTDELYDRHPRPGEGGSLVQHDSIKSQPPTKVISVEPPALSRHPSNLEVLVMSHSSSSLDSLPQPRPPPGPGPGPGPGNPPIQVLELDEASRLRHPQSPSVEIVEPDETSSTGKLFPVQSAQSVQPRSRSRQPQRKVSGDDILEKIRAIRAEVWGLRSNISEKRNVLREMGEAKSIADDKFMKFVRTTGLGKLSRKDKIKEQDTLRQLFEECEALRNDYGPLEDDCNLLENVLNNREYEMQKLEATLEERWDEAPSSQQEVASPAHSAPASNYSASEFSQEFHPLVSEYFSKLGDVEIFHERLDWHVDERLALEEEKERLGRVDKKIADADQHWLDNYAEAEVTLTKQLQEAENEAERLRMRCFTLGLVDEDGEPLEFEEQERKTFPGDEVDPGSEISDFVRFPRLLKNPGSTEVLLPDPVLPEENNNKKKDIQERQDPCDRINYWLLQTLRSSPLDVNLLVRTFESIVGHILEGEKWQKEVLIFWYRDGSKPMATQYSTSLSEVVTHSRQKTGEQQTSLSGRHSMGIVMRSLSARPQKKGEEEVIKINGLILPPSDVVGRGGGKSA